MRSCRFRPHAARHLFDSRRQSRHPPKSRAETAYAIQQVEFALELTLDQTPSRSTAEHSAGTHHGLITLYAGNGQTFRAANYPLAWRYRRISS